MHVPELSETPSTNATKRGQIDHGERVGKRAGLLSREQGSFITSSTKSLRMKEQTCKGRKICK